MSRLFPHPLLSVILWIAWLALNNTIAPPHMLLGALLACIFPLTDLHLTDGHWPSLHRPLVAIKLALRVLLDILVSNVEVLRRVLGPESAIHPGFVRVPLDLNDDWAITALAGIITMTPGTLTADVADDRSYLLVHVFHIEDAEVLIASIKQRYEAPL
ncbi:MAG: Na+/H+ antiporter subunit E, partial [Betaproteobacteria bacterium]